MAKSVDEDVRDIKAWLDEHRPKRARALPGGGGRGGGGGGDDAAFEALMAQVQARKAADRAIRENILYEPYAGAKAGPNVLPWLIAKQHLGLGERDTDPTRGPLGIYVGKRSTEAGWPGMEEAMRQRVLNRLPAAVREKLLKGWGLPQ